MLDEQPLTLEPDTYLEVTSTNDVIWIDDVSGDVVFSVHPWGIEAIEKNASGLFVVDDEGIIIEEGESDDGEAAGADDGVAIEPEVREPDNNNIDDPPVAVDDPVTARSGASVPVAVTANDYDPDGEAIAVSDVGPPGHGSVEIGTASTVIYTPDAGYVGVDTFEYTIVDGDGTEATANVIVELLPTDGTNRAPVGAPDAAETGPGVSVVIDVLLNDVDPERDGLRLDSFSAEPGHRRGQRDRRSVGSAGARVQPARRLRGNRPVLVPAHRHVRCRRRTRRRHGRRRSRRRGEPTARRSGRMRSEPVATIRRSCPSCSTTRIPTATGSRCRSCARCRDGVDVEVQGDQLAVTPLAGSGESVIVDYEVDDGQGHRVRSSLLVSVIDESEPNRPPVVSPDIETAVLGQTILIDVTANDTDPDGDPLAVTTITQPDSGGTAANGGRNQIEFTASEIDDEADANVRFTYTVSDGNGHEVVGDVTVTVLAEALPEPPYARDDSSFTFVDEPGDHRRLAQRRRPVR